jgi:DNA primase
LTDDRTDLVKRVKEANDVVDVVGSYIALRQTGNTYKGLCPFHDDHRPSLTVDSRFQRYRCWSCGKSGDVFNFIMDHDRVDFREALELLARRAGISLEKTADSAHQRSRAVMLDVVKWAAEVYHHCLLDSPTAEAARIYLGERKISGETVRKFGLGYAPPAGDWLVAKAVQAGHTFDTLEKVGLIALRTEGNGFYDRFRDRIIFPIRDRSGNPVGFGGRILPSSPLSAKAPKYYNSSETPLFKKSEQLYGLDQARQAAATAGYLAVVEGYMDVLMAHQKGIPQVVAPMGTALNVRHVQHLLRWVPRVVLVFDADAGGNTGVDRALEIFVQQNVELSIATLPAGLDPCELLVQQGAEAFQQVLGRAVDALEFKLSQVLSAESGSGVEGRRRAVDKILGIVALSPDKTSGEVAVKQELIVNRIARRLAVKEETVWARLGELRASRRRFAESVQRSAAGEDKRVAPAPYRERQLLEVLLAEPELVPLAAAEIKSDQLEHPGLRQLLEGMYHLLEEGETPELDRLRARIDNQALMDYALKAQEVGLANSERRAWLEKLIAEFRRCRVEPVRKELQNQLQVASDHTDAVELLRQLQNRTVSSDSGPLPVGGAGIGARRV